VSRFRKEVESGRKPKAVRYLTRYVRLVCFGCPSVRKGPQSHRLPPSTLHTEARAKLEAGDPSTSWAGESRKQERSSPCQPHPFPHELLWALLNTIILNCEFFF